MARAGAIKRPERDVFLPFLTAFDPTDLAGGSVDPLGFDRGYNCLADKLLPGLTNVASQPRYFGLLCAGASLAGEPSGNSRADTVARERAVMRLERLWALANVLASDGAALSAAGIRGITYAQAQCAVLERSGRTKTGADFALLARQVQYGVLGIYGNVSHGMRLVDRRTLALTPDFGEALGDAFLTESAVPDTVRRAVREDGAEVGVDALRAWGARAHLSRQPGKGEAHVLRQAIHQNPVRSRMLAALAAYPAKNNENEQRRLQRLARGLGHDDPDLREAIAVIVAYEDCYRHAALALERVLWTCGALGSTVLARLDADEPLCACAAGFRDAVARLLAALEKTTTQAFRTDLERLADVRRFLTHAWATTSTAGFAEAVLVHHGDVQRGKFDRGRRKLPWVETREGTAVLTLARAGQVNGEPRHPDDVPPHLYRTGTADALLAAVGEA